MSKYDDIIHLDRPKSKHPSMSSLDRAAQFAPFSALVGYKEAIAEASGYTESKKELSLEQHFILNEKLLFLKDRIKEKPKIRITYYALKDKTENGVYQTIESRLVKIDELNQLLFLDNKQAISLSDIIELDFDYL